MSFTRSSTITSSSESKPSSRNLAAPSILARGVFNSCEATSTKPFRISLRSRRCLISSSKDSSVAFWPGNVPEDNENEGFLAGNFEFGPAGIEPYVVPARVSQADVHLAVLVLTGEDRTQLAAGDLKLLGVYHVSNGQIVDLGPRITQISLQCVIIPEMDRELLI